MLVGYFGASGLSEGCWRLAGLAICGESLVATDEISA